MIGLIPFLIDRFATEQCGSNERQSVLAGCNLPADFTFNMTQSYDDALCRAVITAMVARIGLPLDILYDRLGVFFLAWLHANLGGFFGGATNTTTFLERLPIVYNSFVGSAHNVGMPGATDLVSVRRFDDVLRVTYQSQARFAAFYGSFMRAVADHFGETIDVKIVAGNLDAAFCVFDVAVLPEPAVPDIRAMPLT